MNLKSIPPLDKKEKIALLLTAAVPSLFFAASLIFPLDKLTLFGLIIIGGSFAALFIYTGAHILLLGVPALLLAKKWNAVLWWTCLLAGFLIGCIGSAIYNGALGLDLSQGLIGAGLGLFFWLLRRFLISSDQRSGL